MTTSVNNRRYGLIAAAATLAVVIVIALVVAVTGSRADATGGGKEKVGVCHRTASESNPYVFITVPKDQANGHITGDSPQHKGEGGTKYWATDGTWRGVPHKAGDPRLDYYASSAAECEDTVTPPPGDDTIETPLFPYPAEPTCDEPGSLTVSPPAPELHSTTTVNGTPVTQSVTFNEPGVYTVVHTANDGYTYGNGLTTKSLDVAVLPATGDCPTETPTEEPTTPTETPSTPTETPSTPTESPSTSTPTETVTPPTPTETPVVPENEDTTEPEQPQDEDTVVIVTEPPTDSNDPVIQTETKSTPNRTVKLYTHQSGKVSKMVTKYKKDRVEEGL